MTDQVRDQFASLVKEAVKDALTCIEKARQEDRYISSEYDWISLNWRDNGMPYFINDKSGSPPDYTSVLRPLWFLKNPRPDPTEALTSFDALETLIKTTDELRRKLGPPGDQELNDFLRFLARVIPKKLANRFVHLTGSTVFSESDYFEIYKEYEASVFDEQLGLDLWVPILFLKFTFDELRVGERARISRMTDDFHLARYRAKAYAPGVHESVLSCATHALVLEGWTIKNMNHMDLKQVFENQDAYPKEDIEKFFGALRAVTGLPTGYCQLVVEPKGWAEQWRAHLPTLYGTSIRAYPGFFENFYWNMQELPTLGVEEATSCGLTFNRLQEAKENSLAIAVRRLNRCYCRDDEEDWVIDATIALEALLSDDDQQEMTHKLALRVAAISQLVPGQTKDAEQVFKDIKGVYSFRSKIVHGRTPRERDRVIAVSEQEKIPLSEIAREHLRGVLRVLIDRPDLRSARNVDSYLLNRLTTTIVLIEGSV